MDNGTRHERFYAFARPFLGLYVSLKMHFTADALPLPEGPCIVVANHATDLDPLMIVKASPRHIYFLASEHAYRLGFLSTLLRRYVAPISRTKGASDLSAVKNMLLTLKNGHSICFFPEGSRTFTGESLSFLPTTGRLILKAKVPLITYRLTGGYLASPRWAKRLRRGKTAGKTVRIYTPEELALLGPDGINEAIARDLYVNAYEEQKKEPLPYTGPGLSEGLEEALYLCPSCGKTDSLKGTGDTFSCSCGLSVKLDSYGFFLKDGDKEPPFPEPLSWDRWQRKELENRVREIRKKETDPPFFSDPGFVLSSLNDETVTELARGTLTMYKDRLTLGDTVFPFSSLDGFAIIHHKGVEKLVFTCDTVHYQLSTEAAHSRYKYYTLWTILQKT